MFIEFKDLLQVKKFKKHFSEFFMWFCILLEGENITAHKPTSFICCCSKKIMPTPKWERKQQHFAFFIVLYKNVRLLAFWRWIRKKVVNFFSLFLFNCVDSIFFQLSNAHFVVYFITKEEELYGREKSHKFHFLLKNSLSTSLVN